MLLTGPPRSPPGQELRQGHRAEAPISSEVLHPMWHTPAPQELRLPSGAAPAKGPVHEGTEPRQRGDDSTRPRPGSLCPAPRVPSSLHVSSGLTVDRDLADGGSRLDRSHPMWPSALLYFQASPACHPCQSPWPVLVSSACQKRARLCGFQQQSLTVSQF